MTKASSQQLPEPQSWSMKTAQSLLIALQPPISLTLTRCFVCAAVLGCKNLFRSLQV